MTTQSLPEAAHDHHARLLETINRIPDVADALLTDKPDAACARIAEIRRFLDGTLLPHMDAAERALYPELERMFQNRHSMAPMRREHDRIRELVAQFGTMVDKDHGVVSLGRVLALRRVLFQLYALLKVHVAEEEAYLRIVEHGVTDDVAEAVTAALEHPVAGA
jgi:hemerythrin-like domain-containing protein